MISRKIHYCMSRGNGERVCQRTKNTVNISVSFDKHIVTCRHCLIYMEAGKADVNMTVQEKFEITRKLGSKGFGHGHRSKL